MYHAQRGARQGKSGYLHWSILDGAAALRIPWADLLDHGKHDTTRIEAIRTALVEFERKLAEYQGRDSEALPEMPTPGARMVKPDNTEFYAKLRQRLELYKRKAQAKRITEGAREISRKFADAPSPWRPRT